MTAAKTCSNNTPPWFTSHWRDWHRGHGCDRDDGKPRSDLAIAEIAQHEANKDTGHLTDAELSLLRARTTSGDTLLVRALDELRERRAAEKPQAVTPFRPQHPHDQALRATTRPLRLQGLR
jgi:hypothetical protein